MNDSDIKSSFNKGFSTDTVSVSIPRDFVSACAKLNSTAILLLLHFFTISQKAENAVAQIVESDLLNSFIKWHSSRLEEAQQALLELLESAFLLQWTEENVCYLLPGTPEGRFLMQALQLGDATLVTTTEKKKRISLKDERPNIFKLYETHFGILTPMMADQLKCDEKEYPADWIEDAIREAVQRNVRNWKYVKAILESWKEKGRDQKTNRNQSDLEAFRTLYREQQQRDEL